MIFLFFDICFTYNHVARVGYLARAVGSRSVWMTWWEIVKQIITRGIIATVKILECFNTT